MSKPSKPILFCGSMVRAIQAGQKTVTRRVSRWGFACPYPVGTRLWVKETWAVEKWQDKIAPRNLLADGHTATQQVIWYKADTESIPGLANVLCERGRWRPSIFMPRWASRITLEVVSVRTERLQDITDEDAIREGVVPVPQCTARISFATLWDYLHADDGCGFSSNPYVRRVEFRRVK